MMDDDFILVVLTTPVIFPGEAGYLQGLLGSGVERLHIRKPGADVEEVESLIRQVPLRWRSRLVLHGTEQVRSLAWRYGIPQVHGPVEFAGGRMVGGKRLSGGGGPEVKMGIAPGAMTDDRAGKNSEGALGGIAVSTSVHSMEELEALPEGLVYTFISPLFDSLSKPGYKGEPGLLALSQGRGGCKVVGLGGIGEETIGQVLANGWAGAAVLGWIWERPAEAIERYERLKKIISEYRSL